MAQYILKETGRVVPRCTVEKIPKSDLKSPIVKEQIRRFNSLIYHCHSTSMNQKSDKLLSKTDYDPINLTTAMPESEVVVGSTHVNLMDALINGEFEVERNKGKPNSTIMKAAVLRHVENGTFNVGDDEELDGSGFEVEFEDGHHEIYTANQIAAEIYASVNSEGYRTYIMKEIVDHDEDIDVSVKSEDMYFTDKDGQSHQRRTTAGWNFKVACEDGSKQWVPLWELKEAFPVKVAVYAKARNLTHLPAFWWWFPYVLRKADYILLKVKARVRIRKAKFKFGIKVPTSLEHARELDRKNGNNLWYKAWKKEMENVSVAFEFKHHGYKPSSD